jgi:hypothetical protein
VTVSYYIPYWWGQAGAAAPRSRRPGGQPVLDQQNGSAAGGGGFGQARATDWTEVGKLLPCERGVIRTLLRLLSFCCLFTLSFSRLKSSRLLAIPTFTYFVLLLLTHHITTYYFQHFFLVLDQVFSLLFI